MQVFDQNISRKKNIFAMIKGRFGGNLKIDGKHRFSEKLNVRCA